MFLNLLERRITLDFGFLYKQNRNEVIDLLLYSCKHTLKKFNSNRKHIVIVKLIHRLIRRIVKEFYLNRPVFRQVDAFFS